MRWDAVLLADGDGTIAAVSRELEDMFGYGHGELPGRPVESLVPDGLKAAHRDHRTAWTRAPWARPMGSGARLSGLHADGTTFPVRISLTTVTTAAGYLTLAVVRDVTWVGQPDDPAVLARGTVAAEEERGELLDTVVSSLYHAGLSLQTALDLPADVARQCVTAVLDDLDDIIREIRDTVFAARDSPPRPGPRFPAMPERGM